MERETIKLGGREFHQLQVSTLEHDHWVMGQIRGAGLDRLTKDKDETATQFAHRMLEEAIAHGRIYPLLGGFLVPAGVEDVDWTPAIAAATAEHVRKLTAPEDKAQVNRLVVSMVVGFFVNGLATVTTSRPSSNGPDGEPESTASAAPTTSGTGAASSASLPATTRSGIRRFFAGLFGRR